MKKTAGGFTATVREGGYPIWIDLHAERGISTTLSIEELRDLKYVIDAALRLAEEQERAQSRSAD
jgi:hypothetical protein